MNVPAIVESAAEQVTLPALVDRAATALIGARTAAEVLEARELAGVAYDAAKRAARMAKAKKAHDDLIGAVYRAQADALQIESEAKRRLADEYDDAQARGEINRHGGDRKTDEFKFQNSKLEGIPPRELHDARTFRDAEKVEPGVVKKATEKAISEGKEPSRATVRRAVREAAGRIEPTKPHRNTRADTCARVKDAIIVLSGLPAATEVAGYFRGTDLAILVNEHLTEAIRWLDEFQQAWGDSNADED